MNTFLLMCLEFFKTGLFAIGGGLASIPFLKEISVRYGWFTLDMLSTMIAVSESTPGPIGVNMSTYVGFEMFGIPGGIAATLSLVAPSVILICLIARILKQFKDSKVVQGIFAGLRPAVVGFILAAIVSIFLNALFNIDLFQETSRLLDLFDLKGITLFAVLMGVHYWKPKAHPIILILVAAVAGIVFKF